VWPILLRSVAFRTRRFGSFEVFSPSIPVESAPSPTRTRRRGVRARRPRPPRRRRRPAPGHRVRRRGHAPRRDRCAEHGEQEALIQSARTAIGGRLPVNTDGGCLANGEPIGASGLRQVHEVVLQLRGAAGERQIPGPARIGFTQVYGAPGVSACTVLSR
jgi:hypothetical protein